jgi:hypothetical protein
LARAFGTPVHTFFDAVATIVEALFRTLTPAVATFFDTVATLVKALLDTVAALVEPVGTRGRSIFGERAGGEDQQGCGDGQSRFHVDAPFGSVGN